MKLKKIKYKIATFHGPEDVVGYAIDCDLPVRLCVRDVGYGWRVDHYDTGYRFGHLCDTRKAAVTHGVDVLRKNLESGIYAKSIRAYNRNPCGHIQTT
jgi:hypothetical protein